MTPPPFGRPASTEHSEYHGRYVACVASDDVVAELKAQIGEVDRLFDVPEEKASKGYAPGKWTLKEVLGHLIDTERVFTYRAMSIGRNDPTALPGFDQEVWNPNSGFNSRTVASLREEFGHLRRATIAFFEGLPVEARTRIGRASDNPLSPRAAAFLCAGHVAYHMRIVNERY